MDEAGLECFQVLGKPPQCIYTRMYTDGLTHHSVYYIYMHIAPRVVHFIIIIIMYTCTARLLITKYTSPKINGDVGMGCTMPKIVETRKSP